MEEKTVNIIKDNLTSTLRQRRVKRLAQRIKETNMAHKHDYVFSRHCGATTRQNIYIKVGFQIPEMQYMASE